MRTCRVEKWDLKYKWTTSALAEEAEDEMGSMATATPRCAHYDPQQHAITHVRGVGVHGTGEVSFLLGISGLTRSKSIAMFNFWRGVEVDP